MVDGIICKKKLKNTEIITNKCKCGLVFCSKHKSIYAHNCTYDYSQDMKKQGLGGGIAQKYYPYSVIYTAICAFMDGWCL